ncbi:ABC transporter permease [Olivibacter sp. XZL3]|uniref:ABC transporter permease n=1 Tax=Olivibacter sp. XZL3 TaxID=1735116 RepID=UPI0010660F6D|nr:ABC transporter permease [Olivibacter sp. XZL3]
MLKNYFKIAWRSLMKNKLFSFINILGLSIGITTCMMIFLFILNEFSVDDFHDKKDRIYRVMRGITVNEQEKNVAYLSGPYAPALLNDFKGEIKKAVRVNPTEGLVRIGDQSFLEKKIYDVDSDFLQLFSFPLLAGDPSTVLKDPTNVVLTESTAKKYFGGIDQAMGQVIELDKNLQLKVMGIAKDVPSNSHLDFDLLVPLANYQNSPNMTVWINNGMYTYVLLDPKTSEQQVESRFAAFMEKYMGSDARRYGYKFSLSLAPLKDVYFENSTFDNAKHGDKVVVYIFLSIALLILLIACINFMNLSTIRAVERSKEVGVRKVLGALRDHLIKQFIGESLLLTLLSCIVAVALLFVLMPQYNSLLGYTLTVPWSSPSIWLFLIGLIVFIGLLAGFYPALFLSAFSPIQALKGKLRLGKGGALFRHSLVIIQFSISVFLIIGTVTVAKQMSYIKNKQLGYNAEQALIVPIDNMDIYRNMQAFKTALQNESFVKSVSLMSGEPGGYFDIQMFEVEGHAEKWRAHSEFADFEYVETLGLKIIAGRDLSKEFPTDSTNAVLLNRTAAAELGWTPDQAVGKRIRNTVRDSAARNVVGVVADFNFLSLKENIEPLVISPSEDRRVCLIKLQAGNLNEAVHKVTAIYNNAAPAYPLAYRFLDQQFDTLYKKDILQQTLLSIFAGLAIFIACLGLFGLASFTAAKRIKEIGVRKVLGSSVQHIVMLLSKDLLKPVLIATAITLPVSYYVMRRWLQSFAYQTDLAWWVFLFAAVITFVIAFATISLKAIKAALANPIDSLRNE